MRLNAESLAGLPAEIQRPNYDRAQLQSGIAHLGVGAFQRAHQASYIDDALALEFGPWGVAGVSLRSSDTHDALFQQDRLYTLAVRDSAAEKLRVIGCLTELLVAPSDPEAVLTLLSRPEIRIVTLTITEKGYCHDPATGALNETHPDILHDLGNPGAPRSAPGYLVEALARRRAAGTTPFTVLSCDNLPSNGDVTARILSRFAALRDPSLGAWAAANLSCPNSMVDRIVPATTEEDRARVSAVLGASDAWPVVAEPFRQWVVEDRFPSGRPAWEKVGVEMVPDVHPYETMKLRLLNGSHSILAYLGYLAGYETIAEAVADPTYRRLIQEFLDHEAGPTLSLPLNADLTGYKAAMLARFATPALRHRTWQIAMDGTQKLPQRLLNTIRDRLAVGLPIDRLALGVAGWMRYVAGKDEHGRPIDVRDPFAAELATIAEKAGQDSDRLADGLFALTAVFGPDLPRDPRFAKPVRGALNRLFAIGARRAVAAMASAAA